MEINNEDSGYICSKCYSEIKTQDLVFDEEKYEYYHKECEK